MSAVIVVANNVCCELQVHNIPCNCSVLDIYGVVRTYTHSNWAVMKGNINHQVKMLVTPNVVVCAH